MRESTISPNPYTEAASTERRPQSRYHAAPSEPSDPTIDALFWGIDAMHRPWFRLYAEFITDPIIKQLSWTDQRHYIGFLCLKGQGILDRPISERSRALLIRQTLGVDSRELQRTRRVLQRASLLNEDGPPTNWDARQNGKSKENQPDRGVLDEATLRRCLDVVEAASESGANTLDIKEFLQAVYVGGSGDDVGMTLGRLQNPKNLNENNDIKASRREEKREDISNVHQGDGKPGKPAIRQEDIQTILRHLNDLTGSAFRWAGPSGRATKHAQLVRDVLRQGYTVAQCIQVIEAKARQWLQDDKMRQYLRPSTLFRLSKFETYLDEA